MEKKRICLVTNWYPTPQNPYQGVFFKDQAFAVAEYFDFLILHYTECFRKKPGKGYEIHPCNTEKNTVEYNITLYLPWWVRISSFLTKITSRFVKRTAIEGVGVYIPPCRTKAAVGLLKEIFSKNLLEPFDALYCVNAQRESATIKLMADLTHKPYVVGEHAPFPWPGTTLSDTAKSAIEQADLFLAISQDKIRQILLQNVKLPTTFYIGNMVDERQFVIRREEEEPHTKTFLIVAAHSFYKNYDLFIQVMNRLTEITSIPFRVMVVGYGSNKGYSRNSELLEQKITRSRFAKNAELIPEVSHDRMNEIYNRADAFVMTSIQEGMPVSALEAACSGLPIFSTRCGGVEDYVTEETGRIYPVTDYESFAQGLKDYLEGHLTFVPERVREHVIERFGRDAFIHKFTRAFHEVIRAAAEPRREV